MYDAMGSGKPFAEAFEEHIGMALQDYQDNYWQLMLDYLDDPSATASTPGAP